MVKILTLNTLTPSLFNLPSPFTAFILGLDGRERHDNTTDPATYPYPSKIKDIVKARPKPEGPAQPQAVALGEVKWPAGFQAVGRMVRDTWESLKAFEVVMGVHKAEM